MLDRAENVARNAAPAGPEVGTSGRRWYPLRAAALALSLGAGFLFLASGKVRCAFAATFHIPCPACGSTRAALALLRGDPLGAMRFNPAAPFIVATLAVLMVRGVWLMAADGNVQRLGEGLVGTWTLRLLVAFLVLEVLVWALRFFGLFGGPVPVG